MENDTFFKHVLRSPSVLSELKNTKLQKFTMMMDEYVNITKFVRAKYPDSRYRNFTGRGKNEQGILGYIQKLLTWGKFLLAAKAMRLFQIESIPGFVFSDSREDKFLELMEVFPYDAFGYGRNLVTSDRYSWGLEEFWLFGESIYECLRCLLDPANHIRNLDIIMQKFPLELCSLSQLVHISYISFHPSKVLLERMNDVCFKEDDKTPFLRYAFQCSNYYNVLIEGTENFRRPKWRPSLFHDVPQNMKLAALELLTILKFNRKQIGLPRDLDSLFIIATFEVYLDDLEEKSKIIKSACEEYPKDELSLKCLYLDYANYRTDVDSMQIPSAMSNRLGFTKRDNRGKEFIGHYIWTFPILENLRTRFYHDKSISCKKTFEEYLFEYCKQNKILLSDVAQGTVRVEIADLVDDM